MFGATPIYRAVEANQTANVKILIEQNADLDMKYGENESSLLHLAVRRQLVDIVQLLLGQRMSANVKNKHGETPLHLAVQQFNHNLIMSLTNAGANINSKTNKSNTPLHSASLAGNEICRIYICMDLGSLLI